MVELGAYVDEELPDYIMVMVANKKDGPAMRADLQLFLNANTEVFVEWLQKVLEKLKKVTKGGEGGTRATIDAINLKRISIAYTVLLECLVI